MKKAIISAISAMAALFITSCSAGDYDLDFSGPGGPDGGQSGIEGPSAGVVTAGEWCDLDNWCFWSNLMLDEQSEYKGITNYWQMNTSQRVAVRVTDASHKPLRGVNVTLYDDGNAIWDAVTGKDGRTDCWANFTDTTGKAASALTIAINGNVQENAPAVTGWSLVNDVALNEYVINSGTVSGINADIAFIVDATGSMDDEMEFLKQDLVDIISKAAAGEAGLEIRTATVFYRDKGDAYVTRHSKFSKDASATSDFIAKQNADGGGDYPEAVHSALEAGLQDLDWNDKAGTKLAFMLLDAPAHYEDEVIASLQKSLRSYAAAGIHIIPIAASGIDKSTEFMLRFFAVSTGGTYVFITNDSGVGGDHIQASVGEYKVEKLNDLIVRLIKEYVTD